MGKVQRSTTPPSFKRPQKNAELSQSAFRRTDSVIFVSREPQRSGEMEEATLFKSPSQRRNTPNVLEAVTRLRAWTNVEIVNPAQLTPRQAVAKISSADVFIGQHGAAHSNIFFMPPGSKVVEIVWSEFLDDPHSRIYELLAAKLTVKYSRLEIQTGPFAPIDPLRLEEALKKALET